MTTIDIKNIPSAKKYANAIFSSSLDDNNTDKVYQDIVFITETLNTNEELQNFINSPIIRNEDKKDVINKLFSMHIEKTTLNFLYVLVDNDKINVLNEILDQFSTIFNKERNIVTPVIISAVELTQGQKDAIITKLSTKLNKRIEAKFIVNSDIIGGIVIQIDDKTIDCSLKNKFDNMQKQLVKGNSYGNN